MIKRIVLPNGLRLLLVPMRESLAATVLVMVEAGSEYETRATNGLSHFLEHMCFKGTAKRPRPGMIDTELDGLGAQYNAFTSQEFTGYWAKVEAHKLDQALELVSDLYLNPLFNEAEINKERGVIIEELNMYTDTPTRHIHDIFSKLLYGDTPAGWNVGGTKENIAVLKRDDFSAYRAKHYTAPKTVVVVSGNFNERAVIADIKKYFGTLRRMPRSPKPRAKEAQKSAAVLAEHKAVDQTHIILGVRAFDAFDKRRYALEVMGNILGGGMSSRLFRKVRDELGAAYYISAGSNLFLDHGFFAVSSGVTHGKLAQVVGAVIEAFKEISKTPVPAPELIKAKEHLLGGMVLGLETSDAFASFYGDQEIMRHKLIDPKEIARRIKAVTADDIQAVAKALFKESQLNLALIGPLDVAREGKALTKMLKF